MASKNKASRLLSMVLMSIALPKAFACDSCSHPTFPWPPSTKKPPRMLLPSPSDAGNGLPAISTPPAKCSFDILKLGLCLDVLGGLVHVGLGKPVENVCCPVLQGLLELEAAVCLCTAIKLRVLNLDIYIPPAPHHLWEGPFSGLRLPSQLASLVFAREKTKLESLVREVGGEASCARVRHLVEG
ncbi:putative 36.4 kDa proline-rich protein-like [Cocos nucifera]|uniref:Putative 36.4 kDa proline-rich protein-like n=1 Tax=Cocos nucifera TaxID=13894 RepID=A0A8K0N880_COCNU|nr:putative 36.4 kDa proline-rich protein-like [Cocos nucifera]